VTPRVTVLVAGLSTLLCVAALSPRAVGEGSAAQPRFLNARVEERASGASLERALAAAAREHAAGAWIGYSVPSVPGDHQLCDADRPQRIYLEGRPAGRLPDERPGPAPDIVLLARVEDGKIERLRLASIGCEIDAGGLPVVWLTGVAPAQSVELIRQAVAGRAAGGIDVAGVRQETGLLALALHADPSAEPALEGFAAPSQPEALRRRAVFWLARSRDPRAIAYTEAILRK
jgi:hypothetical protein